MLACNSAVMSRSPVSSAQRLFHPSVKLSDPETFNSPPSIMALHRSRPVRPVQVGIAQASARQADSGAHAGAAKRNVCAAHADARADAARTEVQADSGEDFDGAAKAEAHVCQAAFSTTALSLSSETCVDDAN